MKAMRLLIPISACLLTALLAGCHSQAQDGAPAPPAVQVSSADQSQAEQVSQSYITNLQARNYKGAEAIMSPAFQKETPPARLKALLSGPDRPFLGAKDFQFDPVQAAPHGKHVVLRARFVGGDGAPYRTNFLLAQSGAAWQMIGLIPPATHHTAGIQKIQAAGSH